MTITPEIEAKWREEFESARLKDYPMPCLDRDQQGNYEAINTWVAWRYWLMARSTIEIELPKLIEGSGASHVGHSLGVQQCWAHIESQGYRVKGEM